MDHLKSRFSVDHPVLVSCVMVLFATVIALLAGLPSIWPEVFPSLNSVKVDTDPENMLRKDEAVRVFHDEMRHELSLHDMVVLGIVNDEDPDGVFNPDSLLRIHELTEYAKTLRWPDKEDPDKQVGVIEVDLIAPSTVDNIEPQGRGAVKFEWLMSEPPTTREAARAIREKAMRIPFLKGTMVSEDGKALCLYLPLTSKDMSYRVYSLLREKIATYDGNDRYFITGLPVAEDTFGVEMFIQMGVSAPLAMLVIFLLMLLFFRKLVLIISPMIVAMVSVIITMGLLIIMGNTIHIMSSMIPIFLMPISVLDAIHILSEFFDRYQQTKDRRTTIVNVMQTLFLPMLYTSLTSAAGFASLALTPIPPVQIFGLFVAFGVMLAWLLTISFVPASIMLIPHRWLEKFGAKHDEDEGPKGWLQRLLAWSGGQTYRRAKLILVLSGIVVVVAVYGISRIQINDNPIRWFTPTHPIRHADKVLNEHFGGTYMAYLAFEPDDEEIDIEVYARDLTTRVRKQSEELSEELPEAVAVFKQIEAQISSLKPTTATAVELLGLLADFVAEKFDTADDESYDAWDEASLFVDEEQRRRDIFKQPDVLRYIEKLQTHLDNLPAGTVGKSNSLSDIVKTVHRELFQGDEEYFRVPDSPSAVAQCLITYQNSHRPQDLWHFVTPDYRKTSLWIQLTSGDNKNMSAVVNAVDNYVRQNPPPANLKHQWFGLTYINVIWQEKMVSGMLQAFLGSFLVVFLMMTILFRSSLWGLLSMIPLTVTIGFIYGVIGLIGKDYDMPVAVLSSLTLGLAVDFAIHFLARTRSLYDRFGSWELSVRSVFGEPARAISRNVVVIAVGFLPLLAAPLVPYKTVGVFLAAILTVSGLATLLILPSLTRLLERFLFPKTKACCVTCNCMTCVVTGVSLVALVALNIHQFFTVGRTNLTWITLGAIPVLAAVCGIMSLRQKCRADRVKLEEGDE